MRTYSVLFDVNYLPNFLLLYRSLEKYDNTDFKLYAFCMDESSYKYLNTEVKGSTNISVISIHELLNYFPYLSKLKSERSTVEFYFTCSPFICRYTLDKHPESVFTTYLDADLFFYGNVDVLYDEISHNSILIFRHNFFGYGKKFLKYGKFNVGWVTFKNDTDGNSCLNRWKNDCQDWCYDYYDNIGNRFGDQKYLDKWDSLYNSVKVSNNLGANVGPWNIGQYNVTINDFNIIYINNYKLIFYHYASFKPFFGNFYTTNISGYLSRPKLIIKKSIYYNYITELNIITNKINNTHIIDKLFILNKNRKFINNTFFNIRKLYFYCLKFIFNDFLYFKN